MPKTKTNDPGAHHASSGALIRRFLPYLANYKMVLCLDLFCAALTTLCDIVLPKIMSIITNSAIPSASVPNARAIKLFFIGPKSLIFQRGAKIAQKR